MLQLLSSACPLLSTVGVSPGLFYFICKTSHLLNLWYLCQLWDLSLVSSLDKHRTCRPVNCTPTVSVEHPTGLIWWFICRYFLGSCTYPRYSWAFGTLKQQCQQQVLHLRGQVWTQGPGCLCWTSSDKRWGEKEGHCVSSRAHPSTTDSEIREGGIQGLQRDTNSTLNATRHTERVTQGWGIDMTFHAHRLET